MPRPRPSLPPLTISQKDLVEQWLDGFGDTDSIEEYPEFSLNLGAESPTPSLSLDDKISTSRPRTIGCGSTAKVHRTRGTIDRDCGICFEYAVHPSRTLCCGSIFCSEHIVDWLHGPFSDGRCPSCSAPCFTPNTFSPASPTLIPKLATGRCAVTARFTSHDTTTTTISPEHPKTPTVRSRSGSASTIKQSHTSTSSFASIDSSILGLSPPPENVPDDEEGHSPCWLAYVMGITHTLTHSQSSSSLAVVPATDQTPSRSASPWPLTHPNSSTVEVLSRLTSVVGLTLLFYVLLAS